MRMNGKVCCVQADELLKHDLKAMSPFSDYIKEYRTASSYKPRSLSKDQKAGRHHQFSDSSLVDFGSDGDFHSCLGAVKAPKRQKSKSERASMSAKGLAFADLSFEKFGRDRKTEIRHALDADSLFVGLGAHHPKRARS